MLIRQPAVRKRERCFCLLAGAALVALGSSCSAAGGASPGPTASSGADASAQSAQHANDNQLTGIGTPLDFFVNSYREHRELVHEAEQVVMSTCMARAGFDYPVTGYGIESPFFLEYGPTSIERATEFGYSRPEVMNEPDLLAIESSKMPTDPAERAAYISALNGTERQLVTASPLPGIDPNVWVPGGCAGEAVAAVIGNDDQQVEYEQLMTWAQLAIQGARDSAWNAADGQNAVSDWAACMQQAGYSYTAYTDPLAQDWPDPRPSEDEVKAATIDVACKEQTRLVERLTKLRANFEQQTIDISGDAFTQLSETMKRIADNATNIEGE